MASMGNVEVIIIEDPKVESKEDLITLTLSHPSMIGDKHPQMTPSSNPLPATSREDDEMTRLQLRPPSPPDLRLAQPISDPQPPPRQSSLLYIGVPRAFPLHQPLPSRTGSIMPPFPWASNHRAIILNIDQILALGIARIPGLVHCKMCGIRAFLDLELVRGFYEMARYILTNRDRMRGRAPVQWMNPTYPGCRACMNVNCLHPVVAAKKRNINWLFLLLGQSLGGLTMEQLRYFCKHNRRSRVGSKDQLLYFTYLVLCKQLDPTGPFNI